MELLVGALVVLGFVAILVRFIGRDSSGEIRLPRVVDDSIGMWTLRRVTGRSLGQRTSADEVDGDQRLDPNAADATRAAVGAITAANVAGASDAAMDMAGAAGMAGAANATVASARAVPARSAPARVPPTPTRDIAVRPRARNRRPGYSASMLSPTPILDLRRRQEALASLRRSSRPRRSSRRRRFAALGIAAAVLVVAVIALGFAVQQHPPQGQVLAATGRPQLPGQVAVGAGGGSSAAPSSTIALDVTMPKAAVTGLKTSGIVGSSKLRLSLTWTLTDSGSGLRSQLLQRRTDGGAWVTVSLASVSVRKTAFAVARGHTYGFRIRGTDGSGNVGLFVSRSIRI